LIVDNFSFFCVSPKAFSNPKNYPSVFPHLAPRLRRGVVEARGLRPRALKNQGLRLFASLHFRIFSKILLKIFENQGFICRMFYCFFKIAKLLKFMIDTFHFLALIFN